MILALSVAVLLSLLLVAATIMSLPVAALADAMHFAPERWQQAGHSRRVWVGLMAIGLLPAGVLGAAVAIEYLRTIRPKLVDAPG